MKKRNGKPVETEDVVKVDDIFRYCWGYDQTNVEWFQVVSLTKSGKSAIFRKVKNINVPKPAMMCGTTTPDINNFVESAEPFTKRVKESSYGELVATMPHGCLIKWNGDPANYSTWA